MTQPAHAPVKAEVAPVAVSPAPQPEADPDRLPLSPADAIVRLQAIHGNRTVQRIRDGRAPLIVQRKRCACGGEAGPDGECEACKAKRLALQRRVETRAAEPEQLPESVEQVLQSTGEPLDEQIRSEMEEQFGRDFGDVRLHSDTRAAASAQAISALAYTAGHHIVFGAGRHKPLTPDGRHLLAHELAHVVQQSTAPGGIPTASNGIAPADGLHEQQAEAAARSAGSTVRDQTRVGRTRVPLPASSRTHGVVQRAPETPAVGEQEISVSVSLSGIFFEVPKTVVFKPGKTSTQLLAVVLRGLLGSQYSPGLEKEAEAALPWGKLKREGEFESKQIAKGGEPFPQIHLDIPATAHLFGFFRKKKLEPRLTDKQKELLSLGVANLALWEDFRQMLREGGNPLPAWYTRNIFDREMSQQGALLRKYAEHLRQGTARAGTVQDIVEALYQPIVLLEEVRKDIKLTADDDGRAGYGTIWQLPEPKKGSKEKSQITSPPTRLRSEGKAALFLGYSRTQRELARDAEAYHEQRLELMKRFARFIGQLTYSGTKGDEEIRDQPATSNRPAFPSILSPLSPIQPPLFEAALKTDHRFHMEVQFPSVYDALGSYVFNWERVRIPDDKIGQPVDVSKLKGEQIKVGEVAAVRFNRDTAYAKADIGRAIDTIKSDIGPAGVGALELIGANAILRYVGTGIRLFLETLTMPRQDKDIPFPGPGLYMVRAAMSQVREGTEEVMRAPSVAYYPVLARDPDEIAAGAVERTLTAAEKTKERIKEIEATLNGGKLQDAERTALQKELNALRLSTAPLGSRLEQRRKEAAEREKAIEAGKEPGDLEAATKERETIEKIIALRTKRDLGDNAELLTARFVSDLGQTIPLSIEVVDHTPPTAGTSRVTISDVTTPKSGTDSGTGKTRDDAIANAVRSLLEGTLGYGRGRVAIAFGNGVRTIRIEASMGSLLSEAIDNVAMVASIAAVAAAPFTGGATLAFLVPIGLVGAIPSAYRVAMKLEAGTFEFDLENALEIVNIAGSLIGLGRMGAASTRMMRLGKGLLVIGYGVDAAGGLLMGAQMLEQIHALSKLPPGERSAALLMLLGQTMLSAGVMAGGTLAERGQHAKAEAKVARAQGLIDETPPGGKGPKAPVDPVAPKATANKAQVDNDMLFLGKMDPKSEANLRANEPLRTSLTDRPLAAAALKKCASPCYPPDITPKQVVELDRILARLAKTGAYDEQMLKDFLYKRRADLDTAIGQLDKVPESARLKDWVHFYDRGGTVKIGPSPGTKELIAEKRDRSYKIGTERGREAAIKEGMTDTGFDNPFRDYVYEQGFDDVMKTGPNIDIGDVFIVEHKGGTARLSEGQMELEWVIKNIRRLYYEGGIKGEQTARTLAKALREGRLKGVAYSTPVINGEARPTVKIKEWTYEKRNLKF
jgi:hypothetical protein